MTTLFQPRTWAEIDLTVLADNCRRVTAAVAPARLMAVLKANAYGLGSLPLARALAAAGVSRFGVADAAEALELLPLGLPVQVLGDVLPEEIPALVDAGVVMPLTSLEQARRIGAEAARQGKSVCGHFNIDSGMGRLGIPLDSAAETVRAAWRIPGLTCEGIYSHFPAADDETTAGRQVDAFTALLDGLSREGIAFDCRHIANSVAVNHFPRAARPPFNLVRVGIDLHGGFDHEGRRHLGLRPVLTLKTRLIAARRLPEGHTVGYGCTCRLPRETTVGTLCAGYADGLPLALSNRGHVLIRGRVCPVLGRLSMDYTTVSLEQVPRAAVGDEALCLGGEAPSAATVEEWACLKGTHPYEILCSLGNRVRRCYR
jgi:alanine racemase